MINLIVVAFAIFISSTVHARPMLLESNLDYELYINSSTQEVYMGTETQVAGFKVGFYNDTRQLTAALISGTCNKDFIGTSGYEISIEGDIYNATLTDCSLDGRNIFTFKPNMKALTKAVLDRTITINYVVNDQLNSITFSAMGFSKTFKKFLKIVKA